MKTNRKFELIALDIDGTLLSDDGHIPAENSRVLKQFAEMGVKIVLSSGRMTDCISPVADELGIDCPLVAYNGAMARGKKSESRHIIYHNPLPCKYGDMLIDYCMEKRFHLNYYMNGILYAQEDRSLKKYAMIYSQQTGAKFHFLKDIKKLKGNTPTKLILITDPSNEDKSRTRDFQYKHFSKVLGGKLKFFKTNPEYLEILNRDADKGIGLKKLSEFYGIKRENIIAFGDGENDVEMLEFAGTGVALSNAGDKVKAAADYIARHDNNEAGVAMVLSEL